MSTRDDVLALADFADRRARMHARHGNEERRREAVLFAERLRALLDPECPACEGPCEFQERDAKEEREACAKIADDWVICDHCTSAESIADRIRARGQGK